MGLNLRPPHDFTKKHFPTKRLIQLQLNTFHIPQSSRIGVSPLSTLVSYLRHSVVGGGLISRAEMQSEYSTVPADWAGFILFSTRKCKTIINFLYYTCPNCVPYFLIIVAGTLGTQMRQIYEDQISYGRYQSPLDPIPKRYLNSTKNVVC